MQKTWFQRVEDYLDELEQTIVAIEDNMSRAMVETRGLDVSQVQAMQAELNDLLGSLEAKVAERAVLLDATDAPEIGRNLREKIQVDSNPRSPLVADRCQSLARTIANINQQAVSLFVCQFQLSQFSGNVVRLLAGHSEPATYDASRGGEKSENLGGGLFDEAA